MKTSKLKILVFSDVHLYHDKTRTEHIVFGLLKQLPDNESMRDVDLIVISGDLFDHSVFMPNKSIQVVITLVYHILKLCVKYDIVLRILEGTPSHDWRQSKLFIDINDNLRKPADVRHVVNLSIEHLERFGIDILYVPDEWGTGCSDTFLEVKQLLLDHNLTKVDFSIMHGCFNYQFPVNLVGKPDVHDEASYLSITRHLIFIGHYHTPSVFERIYVPGSFDRLKHGEEEAKGHLVATVHNDGSYDVKFVENKNAMIYKTFDFAGYSVGEVADTLNRYFNDDVSERYIRILADKEDAIYGGVTDLKRSYPFANFSISLKTKEKDKMVSEAKDIVRPNSLNNENIIELMQQRLAEKYPLEAADCISALRSLIDG